jgi:dienelactone hydrolase
LLGLVCSVLLVGGCKSSADPEQGSAGTGARPVEAPAHTNTQAPQNMVNAGSSSNANTAGQRVTAAAAGATVQATGGTSSGPIQQTSGAGSVMTQAGSAAPAMSLRCVADANTPQKTDYSKSGPFQVATFENTLDDASRPIAQTTAHSAAPSRTLVTTIYYPVMSGGSNSGSDLPSLAAGGPFPLMMYSHGYSSNRDEATTVGNRAASHGYIVVAPDFPLSNLLANDGAPDPGDLANQPGDVSFLIDRVLEMSGNSKHVLANGIDPKRIGATGVSMGGATTLLLGFHPKLHDPRVTAVVPIAALSSFFLEGFYHTREMPMLLLHGDNDAFIDYTRNSRRAFERAMPNAHLVTLAKGSHAAFAVQFDRDTIALLNSTLGMPGSDPSNPDGFGCGSVAQTLNEAPDFLPSLGGKENFIDDDPSSSLSPCTGDEYKHPAMDPMEQVAITATAVVAFFDANLASDSDRRRDACRYILVELPKHPGVTVE